MAYPPQQYQQSPQDGEQLPPTKSLRMNIGTGLVNSGFAMLGDAFAQEFGSPSVAAPIAQMGNNISNTLRDRFYKKEFEDFIELYGKKYQTDTLDLNAKMMDQWNSINAGETPNADGTVTKFNPNSQEGFLRASEARNQITQNVTQSLAKLDDDLLQNSGKYRHNPYVNDAIQKFAMSRSQMIQELTGPTANQDYQKNQVGILDTMADINLKNRSPGVGAGQTPADKKLEQMSNMDIFQIWAHGSPEEWIGFLSTHPEGIKRAAGYLTSAQAQIEDELIAESPGLRYNDAQLKMKMQTQMPLIKKRAVILATRASGISGLADVIESHPDYRDALPKPKAVQVAPDITGRMNREERKNYTNSGKEAAMEGLRGIISEESPDSIEKALQIWKEQYLKPSVYNRFAKTKGAQEEAKIWEAEITQWLEENWGKVDLAREKYAKGKKVPGYDPDALKFFGVPLGSPKGLGLNTKL